MKILIEGIKQGEYEGLARKMKNKPDDLCIDGKVASVGYFYSRDKKDIVFVLPKVVLNGDNTVFGLSSKVLWGKDDGSMDVKLMEREQYDKIFEFSALICSALEKYHRENNQGADVLRMGDMGKDDRNGSLWDIIESLICYYRENEDYVMFIAKSMHSGGGKINWNRTVACTQPIFQEGRPIYMNPIYKKKVVDFDEELMVIFFSILEQIRTKFYILGMPDINLNYDLIIGSEFDRYCDGYGVRRLQEIRYKYYSDKAVEMWELCMKYFNWEYEMRSNPEHEDYMLAKEFEHVFEAMVDDLIGDKKLKKSVNNLFSIKNQENGVYHGGMDHIYMDTLFGAKTYFIGDSKYYQIGGEIQPDSVYKQFAYVRNVQTLRMMDLWKDKDVQIYDENTGGYNVILNFFIRGIWNDNSEERLFRPYEENNNDEKGRHKVWHFKDRLFDRDTLSIYTFEVDFMQVLRLYVNGNEVERKLWRKKAWDEIRNQVKTKLESQYDFYRSKEGQENFIESYMKGHWQDMIGKIYKPKDENCYVLALLKDTINGNSIDLSKFENVADIINLK